MNSQEKTFNIHENVYEGNLDVIRKQLKMMGRESFLKLVNKKSLGGLTPLHIASYRRNTRCVEFLLKNGADVNIKDSTGKIALIYACEPSSPIDVELIVLLIDHASNLYEKDTVEKRCALDYFCENRENEIRLNDENNNRNLGYKYKGIKKKKFC